MQEKLEEKEQKIITQKEVSRSEKPTMTEYPDFITNSIERILENPNPYLDLPKLEDINQQLHDEIACFEKTVDKYNLDHKELYDKLISKFKAALEETVPGTEVIMKCFL